MTKKTEIAGEKNNKQTNKNNMEALFYDFLPVFDFDCQDSGRVDKNKVR